MTAFSTAPFQHFARLDGFHPDWLLAHARTCLPNPPASIDAEIEYDLAFNEMILALGHRAISAIHLANFKAYGEKPQRFPIAPITLFFGPNSAGKSSLLHALLYAKHTVAENELSVRHPKGTGTMVDLGKFQDLVHGKKEGGVIQIGFEFAHLQRLPGTDSKPTIWWISLRHAEAYSASLEMDGREVLRLVPADDGNRGAMRCIHADLESRFFQDIYKNRLRREPSLSEVSDQDGNQNLKAFRILEDTVRGGRFSLRGVLPHAFVRPDKRLDDMEHPLGNLYSDCERALTDLVEHVYKQAEYYLRTIDYLSAVRQPPGRDFENINPKDVNHWPNGGAAWLEIAGHQSVRDEINHWFQRLRNEPHGGRGLAAYEFSVENSLNQIAVESTIERVAHDYLMERHEEHEKDRAKPDDEAATERFHFPFDQLDASEIAKRVKDELLKDRGAVTGRRLIIRDLRNGAKPEVSPTEIGVGIQYLVPVLYMAFPGGSPTVIFEEPELHAHPALQAALGDVFIYGTKTELTGKWTKSAIIETHSEHLILRILRRIRETTEGAANYPDYLPKIRPEDVAVIYADPSSEGTILHHLKITADGDFIDRWPTGFFTERADELF